MYCGDVVGRDPQWGTCSICMLNPQQDDHSGVPSGANLTTIVTFRRCEQVKNLTPMETMGDNRNNKLDGAVFGR